MFEVVINCYLHVFIAGPLKHDRQTTVTNLNPIPGGLFEIFKGGEEGGGTFWPTAEKLL